MFQIHTPDTAPEASRPTLDAITEKYGFVPNLAAVFAESPGAMAGLLGLIGAFDAPELTLAPVERQVLSVAVSVENKCEYCTAAHSMLAGMNGLAPDEIENLQQGRPLTDPKLEALRRFAERVVRQRGHVADADLQAFLAAGFTKAQILEVLLGVSLKTLTNYANHIAKPPVNEQFAKFLPKWDVAA